MPFELNIVTKEELRDVVEMLFYAYDESSAFVNAVYPHKITKEGIEGLDMVVARLQYLIDIDPSIRWYKVTDSSTGEIVSASQWNVYDKEKPPEMILDGPPGSWATDEDKKYAIEMFESFIMPRYTRYRQVDLPIICLNIMGTAKKYQHKGGATLQVKKFTALADELNAIITTESTTAARWLYEKSGFVLSKEPGHWTIEAKSPEFADRPKEYLFFMERPRAK
ncbi:hypothetical protein K458DRAFT_376195 [Lentithecium fluviatile CBS 122367]|uniref:N-acetyltransferase domain-containing protein n=1 Tax=Lentithecium fluviatile CBS 122367 TaxID=1168545 RepID=A0A6G1IKM1_9PLEO|nr:hypothetical protein K458DRAFT_376195 [Lentithecium fluviatile CBS 122367]